jgi:hypothetical protein
VQPVDPAVNDELGKVISTLSPLVLVALVKEKGALIVSLTVEIPSKIIWLSDTVEQFIPPEVNTIETEPVYL